MIVCICMFLVKVHKIKFPLERRGGLASYIGVVNTKGNPSGGGGLVAWEQAIQKGNIPSQIRRNVRNENYSFHSLLASILLNNCEIDRSNSRINNIIFITSHL